MRGDRRQIQTAVLGSADSEEPLMLPLEAIELDAFRRQHEHDTFWCGLLLGGCGLQLTTKLYTDRVCHFAHYPGPDGHPHLCGRSARGVASADHLYVKAAADVWLRARGTQAGFDFVQPDGVPIGSVVDIQLPHRKLRVHLDREVAPDWDAEHEPVLGVSVPVDSDTLIRRWYVHRIRLDSEGTTRRVRIGTEAFARSTEWFGLDECEITQRGLSTPAVERIVQARTTPASTVWTPGKKREERAQDVQAHELLRRLIYARRTESASLAKEVCREMSELVGVGPQLQQQLHTARRNALIWVEKEAETRRDLVARLNQAVADQKVRGLKGLLARVKTATRDSRTEEEEHAIREAADHLAAVVSAALARLDALLEEVSRLPANEDPRRLKSKIKQLFQVAVGSSKLGEHRQAQLELWSERLRYLPSPPRPFTPPMPQQRVPLHQQVDRVHWAMMPCPTCGSARGQQCVIDEGGRAGQVRNVPHADRLRFTLQEQQKQHAGSGVVWQVYDVPCPECGQESGTWCLTTGKPHPSRSKQARKLTEQHEPRL
ncbi:hypothetical protein ACFZCG_39155 [Streptomyces tanashiensis]|uniref:zinc finger domain-containing protein n=1 Tax=Streptomyces tanashiensis TaxID=67367 RepID=UPI0036E1B265